MSADRTEKAGFDETARKRKDRAAEIANTFEWLITAFVLAFVFRAFVMEAFRIPTGSMADTLKGAHFRLCCPQCGYKYDYGFIQQDFGIRNEDYIPPSGNLGRSYPSRCPSCGHYQPTGGSMPVANGDRILVLKCIYQFIEPKRWDVIVFKNPLEPSINYIKRLIGLPNEEVEIIDGDIYINGKICRKPPKVQDELWMPVYDNDYQPVQPKKPLTRLGFNSKFWQQPFNKATGSEWVIDNKDSPTVFFLNSPADEIHSFFYDTSLGNDFRVNHAYDNVREYRSMPFCSDLMIRFYADLKQHKGCIGIELSKYETRYKAWIDFAGEMVIAKVERDGKTTELNRKTIGIPDTNKPVLLKFANVDHQLIFQFAGRELISDLGRDPNDAGERKIDIQPQVRVFGSGELMLSHIAIFRDIHYTSKKFANSYEEGKAIEGNPFPLGVDEFFVLGDNSPASLDCRWWNEPGKANYGQSYREGIVPRDYLIGKALFVYWPSGFRAFNKSRFAIIPNIGQMRFIYGGSSQKP